MKYISKCFIEQAIEKDRLEAKEEDAERKTKISRDASEKIIKRQREQERRKERILDKEKERIDVERERMNTKLQKGKRWAIDTYQN